MRNRVLAGVCGLALLAMGASTASAAPGASATSGGTYPAAAKSARHWDMLTQYCVDCHNFEDWAGGIAFDTMNADGVPENAKTWETVVEKLRGGMMPPPEKPRPDNKEIASFVSWLETYLDQAAAAHPRPGYVPLHRLNRKEYAHAVEDLLGLEIDPAAVLPEDNVSEGFDNVAGALQVSPTFMEQYVSAARVVVEKAMGQRQVAPSATTYSVEDAGTQQTHIEGLPLGTRGGMLVEHNFPTDGEYELNIANMAQALWVYNLEFENHLIVTLDGKLLYETTIGGEADIKAIDQDQDPAVAAINKRLKNIRFMTTAGLHKIGLTFVRRSFAESDDRLQSLVPGGGQDRVLRVSSFEVSGPYEITGLSMDGLRRNIFTCYPHAAAEEDACAQSILSRFAERAYRRPVTERDMAPVMAFYDRGKTQDGFEHGVRMGLTRILASPNFLYRAETVPAGVTAGEVFEISDLELASRLSFFLWSGLPDAELRQVAEEGRLRDKAVLEAQVKRMLADPRARTLATNFAYQWLQLSKLDDVTPDADIFPYASGAADPRADYKTEIELFVDHVFRNDRPVTELLTADYTFLNESLALQYGIRSVKGDRFRKVSLDGHSERWGLLGKGGVLMASSYPNRTAPVLRGEWVMNNIMGTPPAAPPPNISNLAETEAGAKVVLTVRERMAQHRTNPSCNSCHGILDPLGFALENFDATGRWRDKDRFSGDVIDASGELPDGTVFTGPDDLRKTLAARPEQFVQTLTKKLMTYALGRTVQYFDMPTVRAIVRDVAHDDYRFSALVMRIVESDEFQKKRLPEPETSPVQEAALQTSE